MSCGGTDEKLLQVVPVGQKQDMPGLWQAVQHVPPNAVFEDLPDTVEVVFRAAVEAGTRIAAGAGSSCRA